MKISIIVPTFDEVCCLARTLAAASALPGDFEILVVDAGSTDGTARIAEEMGIPVIQAPRGRGAQMNRGGFMAQGEVVLFLHADTILPVDTHARIERALQDPALIGGCFRLSFDRDRPLLRFYSYWTRYSCRLFHYGDQAFFIRSGIFRKLQGYRRYPIMEDLDLWLRMNREGRITVLDAPVITSARRYSRCGALRQQAVNLLLVALFFLGVSPFTLARLYRVVR